MSLSRKDKELSAEDSRADDSIAAGGPVSEAAVFRRLYREHAAKRIARDCGVSLSAAKKWLAGGPPEGRIDALIMAARAQLERRLAELAADEAVFAAYVAARERRRDGASAGRGR